MIRPLALADLPALSSRLAGLPLLVRYGRSAAALQRALAAAITRGEGLLVAEEDGAPAGLAWFLTSGTLALGGYLRLLAVLPPWQRRGLGAGLLTAYEAETAKTSGHAFLLVSADNRAAQRFYRRQGYRRVGRLPGLVLPGQDEAIYWKRLRTASSSARG